ncbi:hypothetical protein OJAV_G00057500 [Oryzias javanicus]|uniref:Uncharacterized protein n=1 Tax=Oryzias javanicus TaxID=123683 RepID=A0A3S2UJ03_ORYJA|nr:hypothetical protein OJAV_G00057500 [Oryzias javanicus]
MTRCGRIGHRVIRSLCFLSSRVESSLACAFRTLRGVFTSDSSFSRKHHLRCRRAPGESVIGSPVDPQSASSSV